LCLRRWGCGPGVFFFPRWGKKGGRGWKRVREKEKKKGKAGRSVHGRERAPFSFFRLFPWLAALLPSTSCATWKRVFVRSRRSRRGREETEEERERTKPMTTEKRKNCHRFVPQLTAVRRPPPREPPEPLGQAPVPGLGAAAPAGAGSLAGRGVAAHEARGGAGGAEPAEERGRKCT
jgi:hypothetical protein